MLADLQGRPLLFHVFHRASRARRLQQVFIATDDVRIADAARGFGAEVVMTRTDHRSGTDRIAEAVCDLSADVVVNIQGDEPLIDARAIDQAVDLLDHDPDAEMATLQSQILDPEDLWNPNVVKVVTNQNGYAVYFSRGPIPYPKVKDMPRAELKELLAKKPEMLKLFHRHIGLYAYRRDFLMEITRRPPSPLELLEDLEQLRALENGAKIKIGLSHATMTGVDTPEDLERIRRAVEKNPEILMA